MRAINTYSQEQRVDFVVNFLYFSNPVFPKPLNIPLIAKRHILEFIVFKRKSGSGTFTLRSTDQFVDKSYIWQIWNVLMIYVI